jgi:hypothetical protein
MSHQLYVITAQSSLSYFDRNLSLLPHLLLLLWK